MAKKKPAKSSSAPKNDAFINTVETFFSTDPFKSYNFRQVAQNLGVSDKVSKEIVKTILEKLTAKGTLIELNRGKYKYNPDLVSDRILSATVTGLVDMKSTGKAYVAVDDLDEDVFIGAGHTGQALDGDTVKVHLFPMRKGRKVEGEIVEVLKRGRSQFVGVVQVTGKFAFLIPDDDSVPVDIFIPKEALNHATNGQKVIGRITDWPARSKNPFGEIVQVLGKPGDNNVEMQSILASFEFPLQFKPETLKDADKIPEKISEEELANRRDFRKIWTSTIDPADAKDFDDALSLQKLESGEWEVGVHIADVSHYVRPNTALDSEAYDRGTSIYLVDSTIPMLPEKLSNMVCSLRPNEDKLCFSAVFTLNDQAKVTSEWFGKTIIKSDRRYN